MSAFDSYGTVIGHVSMAAWVAMMAVAKANNPFIAEVFAADLDSKYRTMIETHEELLAALKSNMEALADAHATLTERQGHDLIQKCICSVASAFQQARAAVKKAEATK